MKEMVMKQIRVKMKTVSKVCKKNNYHTLVTVSFVMRC